MYRRTLTINWDGLGEDDDDDHFFESHDRLSTVVPQDLASSGSDDEVEFEDSRRSFSASLSIKNTFRGLEMGTAKTKTVSISNPSPSPPPPIVMEDYGMWMAEPGDVKERRKRLLQGMGLTSSKELLKLTSAKVVRAISRKVDTCQDSSIPKVEISPSNQELIKQEEEQEQEQEPEASNSPPILLLRSRSDGDIEFFSVNTKKRKEQLLGDVSKQRLTRTFSGVLGPATRICQYTNSAAVMVPHKKGTCKSTSPQNGGETPSSTLPNGNADSGFASFFLIKNLDTALVEQKQKQNSSQWIKARQQGKIHKEFTALQLCQEIQAHEGSIWTIRFTADGRYLATEIVFALSDKPVCTFSGHQDDVLDLSWSSSQQLLSSSMDKTVRLWDIETQTCLKMFAHNDYVTCIHFNPVDDDHFISSSLDGKVRIWNVSDRKVVDWTDLHEMVTATCYSPDGEGALIGSHKGSCRMYSTSECKLEQKDSFELEPKKKSLAKKVTGFQFAPGNPAEVLITSADSRVRIFDGSEMTHKFKGLRNTSSQISATFSQDGKYIVSASEDSQVYIWKREEPKSATSKTKSVVNVQSYEHFPCKDVSVAITWPGSIKNQPPLADQIHSRRDSKRSPPPPLPISGSPTREDNSAGANSKRNLPPLPAKKNSAAEKIQTCQDEDSAQESPTDPGVGASASFSSSSPSIRDGDSPSVSSSSRFDGSNNQGNNIIQSTAWGMVIVTASSGGEIRVYQNFGMPLKASRPNNLF